MADSSKPHPFLDNSMTADQAAAILKFINEKWLNHECPRCTANAWSLGPDFLRVERFATPGLTARPFAFAQLECTNFAHVEWLSCNILGILPKGLTRVRIAP